MWVAQEQGKDEAKKAAKPKEGAAAPVEIVALPAGDEEGESTTMYVKNLAFATTDLSLKVEFSKSFLHLHLMEMRRDVVITLISICKYCAKRYVDQYIA